MLRPVRLLIQKQVLFAALSGMSITYFGYFQPYLAFGSALFSAGAGLIFNLELGSPTAKYLGYQVILGIGQSVAIQIPVITGQAFSETADIPAVTAMVLCESAAMKDAATPGH
jgi:MFS transporter, DHA2 family, glioxin efflux transporter